MLPGVFAQWTAMPTKSVCARLRAAVPAGAAFDACASSHSGDPEPNTFVMSPAGPVPVFSRTTFASAVAPQSQPARVYGTHGAGAFFGVPESPLTMFGSGSVGGVFTSSTRSVQYLKDDDEAVEPSARK
jgi:hypothetical protein